MNYTEPEPYHRTEEMDAAELMRLMRRYNLSWRQAMVWVLKGSGHSSQQIAEILNVLPQTVDSHLRLAKRKIGVRE